MPTSLMPKGVEHDYEIESFAELAEVPTSLMPKGVEHCPSTPEIASVSGANLIDAERR